MDLGVKPDWGDVNVVYTRMNSMGIFNQRCPPGSIAGHILSIAVFARAARRELWWDGFRPFLEKYCEYKKINKNILIYRIMEIRRKQGVLNPDPIALLEELSR